MLHLDSPRDRARHAVGYEGAGCAEHQAHEQTEDELLHEPDAGGFRRERGVVDDLDLPNRNGLGDPRLLVLGAERIRDFPCIVEPFGEAGLVRVVLQISRPARSQVIDRGDASVE